MKNGLQMHIEKVAQQLFIANPNINSVDSLIWNCDIVNKIPLDRIKSITFNEIKELGIYMNVELTESEQAILMLAFHCPQNGLNMTPKQIASYIIHDVAGIPKGFKLDTTMPQSKSLYTETFRFNMAGITLQAEASKALSPLFKAYIEMGYSPREITHALQWAINDIELETILDWK